MSHLQARIAQKTQRVPPVNSQTTSLPSPILGWNTRDAEDSMDPRYALQMVNYFPNGTNVRLRQGTSDHATGFAGPVEYLHTYRAGQTQKLFAFEGGGVYDITTSGAIGAPLASGFTNNRWFGTNAGASGGETAIYGNGADAMQQYDGTTWGASGITGVNKGTGLTTSKKRVWGIEAGTGEAWYLDPEAVSGAASTFDIGSVVPSGGELIAIGNVTIDASRDANDLTCFVMASGGVILYAGTDPADAANWSIQGVWKTAQPVGGRCLVPFDGDLILITNSGFISLLGLANKVENPRISDAINPTVSDSARILGANYGWHGIYYPKEHQLIFNIPVLENQQSDQFVMNSLYRPWCRFRGWNAISSELLNDRLYMGVNQKVIASSIEQAQVSAASYSDSGGAINGLVQTAWNYLGARGREKHFKQLRTNIRTDSQIQIGLTVGTDFTTPAASVPQSVGSTGGAVWDVDEWDVGVWAGGAEIFSDWRGANDEGYNISIVYTTRTTNALIELLSTDLIYEIGSAV